MHSSTEGIRRSALERSSAVSGIGFFARARPAPARSVLLFDFKSHPFDQLAGGRGGQTGSGQVAVHEDRIDRVKSMALKRAKVDFAPAGGAHLAGGIEQAEQTDRFEALLRRQGALVL